LELNIYDLLGRTIFKQEGKYPIGETVKINWESKDLQGKLLPSGIYLLELQSVDYKQVQKMLLVK
jgi:hypothetical protein